MPTAHIYVRMSTAKQQFGDSERRQESEALAYAERHGLEISDESYRDIGVSAYRGKNAEEGALARFMEAVRQGGIEPGSYLLINELTRFSRQGVKHAIPKLLDLVNAGIVVVTTRDGHVYDSHFALLQIMMASVQFESGKGESDRKGYHISEMWEGKRRKAATEKMTATCPWWLRLKDDRTDFEIIEERAEVVRRIFEEAASGFGLRLISQGLNRDGHRSGRKGQFLFSFATVNNILKSRATIGFLSPEKWKGKHKEIPGYYPAVVDEALFHRAQQSLKDRRNIKMAGRRGELITNLFTGLLKCAKCGGPLHYRNHRYGYLRCANAAIGICDETSGWRYDEFEHAFLTFVIELNPVEILGDEAGPIIGDLRRKIDTARVRLGNLGIEKQRLISIVKSVGPDYVEMELRENRDAIQEAAKRVAGLENELALEVMRQVEAAKSNSLAARLMRNEEKNPAVLRLERARMATALNSMISKIVVVLSDWDGDKEARQFFVWFANGDARYVCPDFHDPSRIDHGRYYGEEDRHDPVNGTKTVILHTENGMRVPIIFSRAPTQADLDGLGLEGNHFFEGTKK